MIKLKGAFKVYEDGAGLKDIKDAVDTLPAGAYKYVICDETKNPSLPQLKYLFGVVLRTISDALPGNPPIDGLYRYFEEMYAPIRACNLPEGKFEYFNLKNEKSVEVNNVIEKIIHHAAEKWGIEVPERDLLRTPGASEPFMDAYLEMWQHLPIKNQ